METLEELIKASEIVPFGRVESVGKHASPQCCESAKTTAPPSTESSPQLHFNPNEPLDIDGSMMLEAPAWPSIREGVSGWDFCSDASDGEDRQAQIDEEAEDSWCFVADDDDDEDDVPHMQHRGDPSESGEMIRNSTSYADRFHGVPKTEVCPAAHGTIAPPWKSSTPKPIYCLGSVDKYTCREVHQEDELLPCGQIDSRDSRLPRWRKKDKASWNKKQQKKVADCTARRLSQSWRARGWLREEEEEEEDCSAIRQ
jgi:hypothetical protein